MGKEEETRDLLGRIINSEQPRENGLWNQPLGRLPLGEIAGTTKGVYEKEPTIDRETGYLFHQTYFNGTQARLWQ